MIGRELTNFHFSKAFQAVGNEHSMPQAVRVCKLIILQTRSKDLMLRQFVLNNIKANYHWIAHPLNLALQRLDFNKRATFYLHMSDFDAYQSLVTKHNIMYLRNFLIQNTEFAAWFAFHSKWGSYRYMTSILDESQIYNIDNFSIAYSALRDNRKDLFVEAYNRLDSDAKSKFVFDSGYSVLARLVHLELWKEFKHLFNNYFDSVHHNKFLNPDNNGNVFLYYMAKRKCCSSKVVDYLARFSTDVYEKIPQHNRHVIQACALKRLAKYGVDTTNILQSL